MRSGVDVSQFGGVSVSDAGHVQFQNVPEPRPQGPTDISAIPERKEMRQVREIRRGERERERGKEQKRERERERERQRQRERTNSLRQGTPRRVMMASNR